ncbi:MAG: hypothetical protein A3C50_02260 [Candidatus Staskawiczbacteria bacterium RIFCSPHIGHO2_02_FULL_43_16]|uniref:Uncharacterized protein n=1 Tax=Candidatus Staskawiczbacteria bacterium RIFCSPHIGHO2_01_FULL_41_41 TaxID=1802203 RepID=A0A1G2HXY9_9BACT|nr:MAG: hypothetical protein A2822_00630 [Candidatus Staskawiczbacteria bacterium RIFCSPHIGHO2_01_FULL_41_41]OGZ68501.1 MAG: hypothetical protein A3C50_02260 [Candidatus Staskawiczbacteria bacterium RIFCSPHIGHO2_02_FULL_43_16]OGZ74305.1 MAG: hypothetical protein A3A12_02695 [Candidatus Staskawiczbacteria bacterium RIFCSPLOWO2_01_FULL_43_17b]
MTIIPKNKWQVTLLILAGTLIVALAVFSYLVFGAILGASAQITLSKKEVALMQLQDKELDSFKSRYGEYQEDLNKIGQLFVDGANPVAFITFLEGISSDTNITSDVAIAPATNKEGALGGRNITFQIRVYGDFSDVLKFSEKLEAGPYLVRINSFTVKKSQKDADGKVASADAVEAYLLVEALPR